MKCTALAALGAAILLSAYTQIPLLRYVGRPPIVKIPIAGDAYYKAGKPGAPLVVDLHYWSDGFRGYTGTDEPLDKAVITKGWHFVRPHLGGKNNKPETCCSKHVIDGVRAAIDYAKANGKVGRVYVVGGSGGAYTGMCAARSGVEADGWHLWSGVYDLVQWYGEIGKDKAQDIRQCTSSKGVLNVTEARKRSPIYMTGQPKAPVLLYAGTNDKIVPPSHSRRMAEALTPRPRLTIFEGGHEVRTKVIISDIEGFEKGHLATVGHR